MSDPLALLKVYHSALNNFELEKVESMFAENAVYISPGLNGEIKGQRAIMQAMKNYFAKYVDQVSIDESIQQLDANSVRSIWSLIATNSAGIKVKRRGEEIIYFDINGLIKRIEVMDYPSTQS